MGAKGCADPSSVLPYSLLLLMLILNASGCSSQFSEGFRFSDTRQESDKSDNKVHCSRSRSRTAKRIIDEYLQPFLELESFNLSTKCKLHLSNDIFRDQEEHKETLRPTQWQCGFCKKMFRAEEYLDKHFDNRHHNLLDLSSNRCLADVCGAIHCDYVESLGKSTQRTGKCNPAAVAKNRHLCESLANSCFPLEESEVTKRLNDFFLRQFCDAHSCSAGHKRFPRGSGKHKNRALYFALSLFTIILLLIFYGAAYLYRREMNMNSKDLKRLSQHAILKSQKSKKF